MRAPASADACAQMLLHPSVNCSWHSFAGSGLRYFTLRKLECFRQAYARNTLAWNNRIGPVRLSGRRSLLLVSGTKVMINRDSWGH